jgi:hypothetical protein
MDYCRYCLYYVSYWLITLNRRKAFSTFWIPLNFAIIILIFPLFPVFLQQSHCSVERMQPYTTNNIAELLPEDWKKPEA